MDSTPSGEETMTKRLLSGALVALMIVSCGDDKGNNPPPDVTAPGAILDLTISDSTGASMRITWTASGDDAATGTAHEYDMRYATEPITAETWDDATIISGLPDPAAAGEDESATLDDATWWTRYYVGIRVADEAGNWSEISNIAAGTSMPKPDDAFLVRTQDGILKLAMDGSSTPFLPGFQSFEVTSDRIYCGGGDITVYDYLGTEIGTIDVPSPLRSTYFAALPNHRFIVMNNSTDTVHIIDDQGGILAAIGLLPTPDFTNQFLNAVVAGNDVLVSEDGQGHVMRIDLNTYAITQFIDMTTHSGWVGAVDYRDGVCYVCQSQDVFTYTPGSAPELLGSLPSEEYHIIGAVTIGGHVFVSVNFAGKVYRINRATGEVVLFADGLTRPEDLEFFPAPEIY